LTEWVLILILINVVRLDNEDLVVVFSIGQGCLLPHLRCDFFFFLKVMPGFLIKSRSHSERLLLLSVLVLGFIVISCKVREELLINVLYLMFRPHYLLLLLHELLLLAFFGGVSFDL
jgi:hypothetical protein